jgi:hypothetical protein
MGSSSGNIYAPSKSDTSGQNNNATNLLNQNTAAVNGYAPNVSNQAQGLVQNYINNPYAQQAQQGANTAGAYGTNTLAPQQAAGASSLNGLGGQYAGAVGSALNTGFSPNNALYGQQYGQAIDQSNAINAMNGVSGTPYGAGLVDQASQNFNNSWNLNQANLQSQAANTASNLGNAANSAYTGGSNLGQSAFNTYGTAGAAPSNAYTGNLANDLAALSGGNTAIGGATGINNSVLGSILQYLQYGNNAQTGQQQEADANNPLSALGSLFGMNTGGGGTLGGDALGFLGL